VPEALFGPRSGTAIQSLPLERVERGVAMPAALERRLKSAEPESEEEFVGLLAAAKREAAL